jgi:PPK2 family polyphosphate:nucleotide phosphotransferase
MDYSKRFIVAPGEKVKLKDIEPGFTDKHKSAKDAREEIENDQKQLRQLQQLLYAGKQHSVLICLQAMDTGGKDGTINHVLGAMNPQGCRVVSFKRPSTEELSHDFLWRIHRAAPARGEVVIFNRSQYEDVLIVRVHDLVAKDVWQSRYDQINSFEEELVKNNVHILKFYLHISKSEQLKRFKERLDDPAKQWKISEEDYKERAFWNDYTSAYQDVLSRCSTKKAPWFIIPANHKWFRNLAISRIVVEHLEQLNMKQPLPSVDLKLMRKQYHAMDKT